MTDVMRSNFIKSKSYTKFQEPGVFLLPTQTRLLLSFALELLFPCKKMSKEMRRTAGDQKKWRKNSKVKKNVKVVHISNPLMVTLSASEYKERVQQLTGQDSYVADIMFQEALLLPQQPKEGVKNDHQDDNHDYDHDHETGPSAVAPYPSTDNQPDASTSTPSRSGESPKDDMIPFDDFLYHRELMATRCAELYYQDFIDLYP